MTTVKIAWWIIGLAWGATEIAAAFSSRNVQATEILSEKRSQTLIWLVIVSALLFALSLKKLRLLPLPWPSEINFLLGLVLFASGIVLRIYSVYCLGRFFTTTVAIQSDHRLVKKGPYRYIRHPSYSGLLCSFLGAGIAMGDLLSALSLLIPILTVLSKRISIEEQWLLKYFGERYRHYCLTTKKLIPGLF